MTTLTTLADVLALSTDEVRALEGEQLRRAVLLCMGWRTEPDTDAPNVIRVVGVSEFGTFGAGFGYSTEDAWADCFEMGEDIPNPVTNDADTMPLIREGRKRWEHFKISNWSDGKYCVRFRRMVDDVIGKTMGEAVCRAFILAVMAEQKPE